MSQSEAKLETKTELEKKEKEKEPKPEAEPGHEPKSSVTFDEHQKLHIRIVLACCPGLLLLLSARSGLVFKPRYQFNSYELLLPVFS